MINNFILEFKKTAYYNELIKNKNVICIYIAGSNCTGLADEFSDYDLIVLTLNGDFIDVSKTLYLNYKGKKVHWYYFPIKGFFDISYDGLTLLCPIQLRKFSEDLVIYKNPNYLHILEKLLIIKNKISDLAIYRFYDTYKTKLTKILAQNEILNQDYSKFLYHLCFCTYCLLNEDVDLEFLKDLKLILRRQVRDETKQQAIKYLKLGVDYINKFPRDYRKELIELSYDIYK